MEELVPELLPLETRDIIAFTLATVGLMVSAFGGVGGGGILVPIYILVLSFTPKHAIPLSNITVFGGALANLLLNYSKRHPAAHRPLIDWDLILIMEPLTISGALIGANLNVLLPDMVMMMALVVLLSLTGYMTFHKALNLYRQEVQGWHVVHKEDGTDSESTQDSTENSLADIEMPVISKVFHLQKPKSDPFVSLDNVDDPKSNNQRKRQSIARGTISQQTEQDPEQEKEQNSSHLTESQEFTLEDDGIALVEFSTQKEFPNSLRERILRAEQQPRFASIFTITALFMFVLMVNLLKGGGAFQSPLGIRCGSTEFWMLDALVVVATLGVTLYARSYLLWQGRRKAEADYQYHDTDITWNETSTLQYPVICTLAGLVAGLCGIGGGLIKAPLLLALGVHPAVASATSATMILFTTFTATTSFLVYGMLIWDYGLGCLLIGFCATLMGQLVMNALLQRTGKTSYIAFCFAGVVLVSAVTMTAEWGYTLLQRHTGGNDHHHEASGFCGQE